jgi:hypothetical protein
VAVLLLGTVTADGALAVAVTLIGFVIAIQSIRALNPAQWQAFHLASEWVWLGLLFIVWIAGILLGALVPESVRRTLPVLIVAASGLASLLFLSVTLRGLVSPTERKPLSGRLLPQHTVLLSASLSATFSTLVALVAEGILLAIVMAIILLITRWFGDQLTLEMLEGIGRDPQTLSRLQDMIVRSPVALVGLGSILVFIAPAVEETVKGLPLFLFGRSRVRLTERAAILLGVTGGIGFAFAENVGYMSMLTEDWWLIFWFRVCAAIMHGGASGFIGRAWYKGIAGKGWGGVLLDVLRAWGAHALWNALAVLVAWFGYQENVLGVLFSVIVGLIPLAFLFTLMARWGIWVSER